MNEKIIQNMQQSVEDYDFNKHYIKNKENKGSEKVQLLDHQTEHSLSCLI